ncbi:MAG: FHA domain protein [Deltaproteobacteria bacterium ADurb.Bin207]|nr:MAG: FHA domain protein [Deltaproteobacteria bacterium ADurb.Bin207]
MGSYAPVLMWNEERICSTRLRPCLTVVHHPRPELVGLWTTFEFGASLELGRQCLCLGAGVLSDPQVSHRHVSIRPCQDRTAHVVDLGSKNGTFVNLSRVTEAHLQPGDVLGLGGILLLYHMAPPMYCVPNHPRLVGMSHRLALVIEQISKIGPHPTTVFSVVGSAQTWQKAKLN